MRLRPALALLPLVAACAAPVPRDVSVRHVESTETAGGGARWHLFLFDPAEPRDLDTRIALARREVSREGRCRWADRPRSEIVARTDEQGLTYADTVLAAALICEA